MIRKPVYQFAHRVLPEKFLGQPERWLTRLAGSGGQRPLEELWNAQRLCYTPDEQLDYEPLHYVFEETTPPWRLVILQFPRPEQDGEPLMGALAFRPVQAVLLGLISSRAQARYFVTEQLNGKVRLVEWTSDLQFVAHGPLRDASSNSLLNTLTPLLGN
jgi:hypothetical protein